MKNKSIYILGVGHNTIVYIDLAESCGYEIAGLYHYNNSRIGEIYFGHKIIGTNEDLLKNNSLEGKNFALSMGDNKIRYEIYTKLLERGATIPTLIHPQAIVSKYSELDSGVVIHANSVVQAHSKIGSTTVVSYNSSVSHDSTIGIASYIAFGACIGAYVSIGNFTLIGQAASIVSGKVDRIGNNCIIGAGSVVINNIEDNTIVAGNPAKIIKKN